ncbi:MAG: flagellar protein export ATPase FliI [Pseudomonadota bacterium]
MSTASERLQAQLSKRLKSAFSEISDRQSLVVAGLLRRTVGLTLEAEGCSAAVGTQCDVIGADGHRISAEVVGFAGDRLFLMPTSNVQGIAPNARVTPISARERIPIGEQMLGRVLDGNGRPLDSGPPIRSNEYADLNPQPINPLQRQPIHEPLDVGIRAINALLPIGRGQRLGLFAGSGVGKSVLLGMMTRFTEADVVVVGLIGERGREVKEFVDHTLGADGLKRAVVIACPADETPLMRLQGASLATAVAEHFRDQGKRVLLLMDSLTRYAQAQREIALAIGEPPATKGYPPSVFAKLPQLVERAGNGASGCGSITAIYTVLAEGDDQNDPIVDAARAILDGHIVLSRALADAGHYPAIDIEASVSRATLQLTTPEIRAHILELRKYYGLYQENRDLISIGAYQTGNNADADHAIALWPALQSFLQQAADTPVNRTQSLEMLAALAEPDDVEVVAT